MKHQTYNPPTKPIAATGSCETSNYLDELDDQMETITKETRELQRKINNKLLNRTEARNKTEELKTKLISKCRGTIKQ
jgi:uncharacterized protein YoxC